MTQFPYVEFLQAFVFRGDTFAVQQADGSYKRVFRRPTLNDLREHLEERTKVLALYPSMEGRCYLGVIDLDVPHSEINDELAWETHENEVALVAEMMAAIGLGGCTVVEETGGRGSHIWLLSEEIAASTMYHLLKQICDAAGVQAEIFPVETPGLGKGIRLPLGTHRLYKGISRFVDPETREEISVTSDWLKHLDANRMTVQQLGDLGFDANASVYEEPYFKKTKYEDIPKHNEFSDLLMSVRYCFKKLYQEKIETSGGQGWNMMTAIGAELLGNGALDEHVHQYMSVQKQYKRRVTNKHLRPLKRKNISPYRCSTLQTQCGKYVLKYCPDCPINSQEQIHSKIEAIVDKNENKEDSPEGVDKTLKQFDVVAWDIKNALDRHDYTIMMNGFNGGKSWSTVSFLKKLLHEDGLRANFITPSNTVKDQMIGRFMKAGINYLDNPSNMTLCPRSGKFASLGYVPSVVCKSCENYMPIQKLIRPMTDEYIDASVGPVSGTHAFYQELANEYSTCAKWVYLAMLEGTKYENLVLVMNDAKVRHHAFIESSPLLPALASPSLFCNIIDQIDYIDRRIPKFTVSDKKLYDSMRKIGILVPEELDVVAGELEEVVASGDLSLDTLDQLQALDYVKQVLHLQKKFDYGELRKVYHRGNPGTYTYDYQGDRLMKPVLNDVYGQKINPRLYDNVIKYISDIEVTSIDELARVPQTFSEIVRRHSDCEAILGLTATPTEIEVLNNRWLSSFDTKQIDLVKNLYELPRGSSLISNAPIDSRTIIYSRKQKDKDYINDAEVRGNTGLGGVKDSVIIESLQYPKNSEEVITDLVQIFGGNLGQGMKVFYQSIVGDALTQAHKYEAEKIYVPDADIFSALGFDIKREPAVCLDSWYDKIKEKLVEKDGLYRHQMKRIPDDVLEDLITQEYIGMKGKKYIALRNT